MKNCAFTICTRNYFGLAKALENSFLKYNEDFDFYIIFADYTEKIGDNVLDTVEVVKNYIDSSKLEEMRFKYDLTEFCTSIKPFSMLYFFDKGYELVAYFDPDILFFSKYNEIYNENKIAFVTPHILSLNNSYEGDKNEEINYMRCGVYNCGFAAFRNSIQSRKFVEWWAAKLEDYAFADYSTGLFTDQKWMDFVSLYIDADKLFIIKNYGCNVAPWNFFERKVIEKNGSLYVQPRKADELFYNSEICFAHISAYDYSKLQTGVIEHKYRGDIKFNDIEILLKQYGSALKETNAISYFNITYKYLSYDNNKVITKMHRRLYRGLLDKGINYTNLFSAEGEFYRTLEKNKLMSKINKNITQARNVSGYSKKEKMLYAFYKLLFMVLGIDSYSEMLRALELHSRFEESTWLIGR